MPPYVLARGTGSGSKITAFYSFSFLVLACFSFICSAYMSGPSLDCFRTRGALMPSMAAFKVEVGFSRSGSSGVLTCGAASGRSERRFCAG